MHDWQRRELTEQIATGAAIYNLLRQGYKLADIVDSLDLADCREAQRLVALFLSHGNPTADRRACALSGGRFSSWLGVTPDTLR